MKFSLFFSLLLLAYFIAPAQTIKVMDTNHLPIENVIVLGDNFSSHTDAKGVLLYFPEEGSTHLAFMHPNYKRITLTWDQLVKCDLKVVLEQHFRQLKEVTIRPSKREQTLSDVPQKVIALTPKDAEILQPQTTADLLSASGEVFIQKSQMGGGSPMIRGFSANRIMLVVDGVRMNNAIFRSGNLHNVISLDASSLEQTEVILGPGSVIYGSDALGGVLHFYTFKPRLSTSETKAPIRATLRTSSANFEKSGHINFNLAGKHWASMTSASFSDYDDLRMGSWGHPKYTRNDYVKTSNNVDEIISNSSPNRQIYTGYSQMNMIQKIRFRPSEIADFEYAFHFSRSSDIPRYDRLSQYSGEKLKYAQWYYGPTQWMMHSLKVDLNLSSNIMNNLTILAAVQDYTESRHDRKFQSESLRSRTENVDIYSMNIDADKFFSKTQSLFYGFEGVANKVHSTGIQTNLDHNTSAFIAPRYPDGSNWWSLASYVMYNQILNAATSLQAGMRYNYSGMNGTFDNTYYHFPFDDFNDSNGAISVNFGMVFTPNNSTKIKMNTSTGFRSPNIDDAAKVFDSEPGKVIVPNPDLNPEYASSFEVGFEWNNIDRLHLDITLFYTRLYNAMVRRDGQINGMDSIVYDNEMSKVQMLSNASWANLGGISSQIQYRISPLFKIKGSINWQTGRDSDELPMRHIAPMFGDFHLLFLNSKLKIDAYLLANGAIQYEKLAADERDKTYLYASDENGNPYTPAWYTLNLKSTYQFSEIINLSAGVENLLDVRYRPYSSGIVAPGINFIFSVGIKL